MADFGARLITVGHIRPIQAVFARRGPVYLVNRDLVNTVYLGSDEGMDASNQDVGVLDPLGSLPLDGEADVWALTQAGTAIINALPGTSAWAPSPGQVAAQIGALGLATLAQQVTQETAIPANISTVGINGSLPMLIDTEVLSAASGPWGNFTTALPQAAGSYLLAITPATAGEPVVSDFIIDHLDAGGVVVHTDFFGAVYAGTLPGGLTAQGVQCESPTLLRGNIYGTQLRVSGIKGTAAFTSTVTGGNLVGAMSGFTYRLYSLPYNIPDSMPKMSNGNVLLASSSNGPGGILAAFYAFAIAAGVQFTMPLVPYSGPAVIGTHSSASALTVRVVQFSVSNGTTPISRQTIDVPSGTADPTGTRSIDIANCLNVLQVLNSGGVATTADVSVVAGVSA